MQELVGYAMGFILVIVIIAIAGAVAVISQGQADVTLTQLNVTSPAWYSSSVTSAGTALNTFASFLPILAIAIVGGLAVLYIMRFLAGGQSR